jgi:hypothetical protein
LESVEDERIDVPGSFGEVAKAHDTGAVGATVYVRVMAVFHSRMALGIACRGASNVAAGLSLGL